MTQIDDGGPVFSQSYRVSGCSTVVGVSGMTLRDWFAGQAMAAMVNSYRVTVRGHDDSETEFEGDVSHPRRDMLLDKNGLTGEMEGATEIAFDAYAIADAMIDARKGAADGR